MRSPLRWTCARRRSGGRGLEQRRIQRQWWRRRRGGTGGSAGAVGGAGAGGGSDDGPGGGDPEVGPSPAPDMAQPDAPLSANGAACTGAGPVQLRLLRGRHLLQQRLHGRLPGLRHRPARPAPARPIADGQDPDNECAAAGRQHLRHRRRLQRQRRLPALPRRHPVRPGPLHRFHRIRRQHLQRRGRVHARATCAAAPPTCASGDSCASSCTAQTDCQSGFFCDSGTCRSKRPNGMACTDGLPVRQRHLRRRRLLRHRLRPGLPGLQPGRLGRHLHVDRRRQDPGGECPAQAASTCGRWAAATAGGPASCTPAAPAAAPPAAPGSPRRRPATCNGAAAAPRGGTRTCPGFLCSGTACGISCTTTAQCQANHKCVRSVCAPLKIASLTVHDTDAAQAAGWSVQPNFQIGTGGAHPWTDYPDTLHRVLDTAAQLLPGQRVDPGARPVEEVHRRPAGDHHPERHRRRLHAGGRSLADQLGRPRLAGRLDRRRVQDPGVRELRATRCCRSACSARPARPAA